MAVKYSTTEYRFGHLVRIHAPQSRFNGLTGEIVAPTPTRGWWVRLQTCYGTDCIPFERAEVTDA